MMLQVMIIINGSKPLYIYGLLIPILIKLVPHGKPTLLGDGAANVDVAGSQF